MSGFFSKLKDAFTHKQAPKFKIYEPSQLKMIAMRTRVVLQTRMAENLKHITSNDQQFKYVGQDPLKIYNILQLIGQKVMQVQTMKILIEIMRKVQNLSPQIVRTNGDIAKMRKQLIWFQCLLWFRKTRQIDNLQQLNKFCWDFFKGVDITTQLDLKCEVFQIYPVLKFLKKGEVLPLREILFYIQPYVSCNIQQNTLDSVFKINTEEIKKKIEDKPINKHKFASTIPQYQGNNSQIENNNYIPQNQAYYSNIKQQSNIYVPYTPPVGENKPYNTNPYQSNSRRNQQSNQFYPNINPNYSNLNHFYYNNQRQQYQQMPDYSQNYINFNQIHPQNNQINDSNLYSQNHNTYNRPQTYNIVNHPENALNVNTNLNKNAFLNNQPTSNISNQEPSKPIQHKPSFYNSLLRVNSNAQNDKQTQPKVKPKPLDIKLDNQRQTQNEYQQQFQSALPFINQINENKDTLIEDAFQKQMRQLEMIQIKNNLLVQEEIKRKENERIQKQLRLKRQQQEINRLQAERIRLQQLRIQLQEQSKKRQQQNKRRRQLQEKQREQQYQRRLQQQQQRRQRQQEERREREEQQRQKQYQARRQERQREERESSEIQLNVFADNEREEVDRGLSGRFSSTFGMRIDLGQNQGEQFNFQSPHQVKSSILRFSKIKEENQQSEQKQVEVSLVEQDEEQSLNIIKQFAEKSSPSNFKLFYFKAMKASQ